MMKKFLKPTILAFILFLPLLVSIPSFAVPTNACSGLTGTAKESCEATEADKKAGGSSTTSSSSSSSKAAGVSFSGDCRTVLGLKSWDCGVNISNKDTLKSGIWQIALNIAENIAVIASYLIMGYVIYAGYLYMFSAGDPGKVAAGKKTLLHAFIGLAIVMLAKVIMGTINTTFGSEDPTGMISSTISWFIAVSGIVAVIFVLYSGFTYMTSAGNPSQVQKAKQALLYSLIGLAIVALSAAISTFIFNTINKNAYQQSNDLIISKEVHGNTIT